MTVPAAQTGGAESADAVGQLQRALTQHHKKLLVFTVQPKREDPAQTVAIYIPETYPEPGDHMIPYHGHVAMPQAFHESLCVCLRLCLCVCVLVCVRVCVCLSVWYRVNL